MARMDDLRTLQEIALEARRRLSVQAWDYLSGGSESETTLRRNRLALDSIAFRPRVLNDVAAVDATTTLLGIPMRIPVFAAPIGSLHLMNPGAAVPVVKASAAFGSIPFISTVSSPGLEETAAAASGRSTTRAEPRSRSGGTAPPAASPSSRAPTRSSTTPEI